MIKSIIANRIMFAIIINLFKLLFEQIIQIVNERLNRINQNVTGTTQKLISLGTQ
jgi:hypothetical protein